MADFAAHYLSERGFKVEWDQVQPGRPNILARYGSGGHRRTLMLESHLDTVGVTGMKRSPFEARIDGNRMYGRGTCDTKGPMAAALHAMSPARLEKLAGAGYEIVFAGAMGEETGNVGAGHMVERGVRADQILVLEPTELNVIHAHKGAIWFEIDVSGVAAHGSNPDKGINAISAMADLLIMLREQIAEERDRLRNPVLGSPTLNIGAIRGGTAVNIVADRCVVQIDRRTLPEEHHDDVLGRIGQTLKGFQQAGRIKTYEIRILKAGVPFETSVDSSLVRALEGACRRANVPARKEGAAWYSDAGPLSKVCSEIAVFGPGSISQAHTTEEFIDLDSLQAGCDVLRNFFDALVEQANNAGA